MERANAKNGARSFSQRRRRNLRTKRRIKRTSGIARRRKNPKKSAEGEKEDTGNRWVEQAVPIGTIPSNRHVSPINGKETICSDEK